MIITSNGKTYRSYESYIRSDDWGRKRKQAIEFYGGRCALCGDKDDIHVHHINYETLGKEEMLDLTLLCEYHHNDFHKRERRKKKRRKVKPKYGGWFDKFKHAPLRSKSDEIKDRIGEIRRALESINRDELTANEHQLAVLQETRDNLNEELEQKISEYIKL